jgi:hypothetical protein
MRPKENLLQEARKQGQERRNQIEIKLIGDELRKEKAILILMGIVLGNRFGGLGFVFCNM